MKMRTLKVFLILILLVPAPAGAEFSRYHSRRGNFSIEIPESWAMIDPNLVGTRRAKQIEKYGTDFMPACEAAFQRANSLGRWFMRPYFLVQVIEQAKPSEEAIRQFIDVLAAQMEAEFQRAGASLYEEVTVSEPVFDPQRWTVTCEISAIDAGAPIRMLYHFVFCEAGIAGLYFYSGASDYDLNLRIFLHVTSSMVFVPGHEYANLAYRSSHPLHFLRTYHGKMALAVVIIIAMVAFNVSARRKLRASRRSVREEPVQPRSRRRRRRR
ncbi:hypothetical protein ACFL4G_08420 [Thermodesulfobacteriota bacterium]